MTRCFSRLTLLSTSLFRLGMLVVAALLAACAGTEPSGLKIDRSVEAESHNSRISMIVLHYTAADAPTSLNILSKQKVSSHYLITDDRRPHVYQLVDEHRRAWHAGVSEWYGSTDVNSASIGIEIVNPGGSGDTWAPYSDAQIDTVIKLVRDVAARHDVRPHNIVGHSDVAPQRKTDPGPAFPWEKLAKAGVGRWYSTLQAEQYAVEFEREGLPDTLWMQNKLKRAGYAVPQSGELDKETRNVLAAFQMHYRPARHNGKPDAQTLGILKALP